jgi:hypothetical protein
MSRPKGHNAAGKLTQNPLTVNRTQDLPAFSIVPQPTTLPRVPFHTLHTPVNARGIILGRQMRCSAKLRTQLTISTVPSTRANRHNGTFTLSSILLKFTLCNLHALNTNRTHRSVHVRPQAPVSEYRRVKTRERCRSFGR